MTKHGLSLLTLMTLLFSARLVPADGPVSDPTVGQKFWRLTGNAGTDPDLDFLGTKDAQDLVVKTNSAEAVRITPGGHVGIGTADPGMFGIPAPLYSLDVRNPNPFSVDTVASISSHLGQALLHLQSLNEEAGLTFHNASDGDSSAALLLDRDTGALHFCVAGNDNCQLATEVRISVEPSGNVGVGTKTPQSALQVVGYVQLDLTGGAPPLADCDEAAERGRLKVDSAAGALYVCADAGWLAK